jgi:hypothetical protein
MRNMLALVGLLVVVGGGAGWYLGWYKVSFTRGTDGTLQIKADVDTTKVETDSSSFFKKAATAVGNHLDKSGDVPAPAGMPGPTQASALVTPPLPADLPAGPLPAAPTSVLPTIPVPPAPSAPVTLVPPK